MEIWKLIGLGVAGFLAGGINALAGGGTLISFPALTIAGLPIVAANMTNTVALCPGYFGAAWAQFKAIKSQRRRILMYLPAAILGGLAGGYLLTITGNQGLKIVIPYLLLMATILLALGEPIRNWLTRKSSEGQIWPGWEYLTIPAVALVSIYGGYFGAGLSVIYLAILGVMISDSLPRLNAVKQVLALATNLSAAIFFLFSGRIDWTAAVVVAIFALIGGAAGGRVAGKINPVVFRWVGVIIGLSVSIYYFLK